MGAPPIAPAAPPAVLGKPAPAAPQPTIIATPTSTAAVAAGASRQYDPLSNLRIADTPVGRPATTQLRQPQPGGQADVRLTSGPTPSATRVTNFEQAKQLLASRGVKWQRLEMVGDQREWSFSCSVPSRQNPNLSRTYEAHSPDPLAAIQAVLDQMDRENF